MEAVRKSDEGKPTPIPKFYEEFGSSVVNSRTIYNAVLNNRKDVVEKVITANNKDPKNPPYPFSFIVRKFQKNSNRIE